MAGETVKSAATCLDIRPWSRTSHVVTWLTPHGKVSTVVKGAVRAKSAFLGQYDLNYTCELLYYARAKGELHALRECLPLNRRDALRTNYRALALAGYFRGLVSELAPSGEECGKWFEALEEGLDSCAALTSGRESASPLGLLIRFELKVLELAGLKPDFSGFDKVAEWSSFSVENGTFCEEGRCIRIARAVAAYLCHPESPVTDLSIPLDAARVIGVFYQFHVDCASDVRRTVLGLISENEGR